MEKNKMKSVIEGKKPKEEMIKKLEDSINIVGYEIQEKYKTFLMTIEKGLGDKEIDKAASQLSKRVDDYKKFEKILEIFKKH